MKKIILFASALALLASCSKDFIDDAAAPSIQGNNRIIASYEADSNAGSRSHLDGRVAGWDAGDALGVFAAKASDATNAYFGFDGTAFVGDLQMVKGDDIYVYYPWSSGKTLGKSARTLTLSIPATQYYNHKYAAVYGSYAAGMVPAVAKAEGVDKSKDLELELQPVVSYIGIPIKGVGTVGEVTLTMTTGEDTEVVLTGNVTVDFATPNSDDAKLSWKTGKKDETEFSITGPTGSGKKITLNCGDGVELSRTDAKYFVFVVPAYIDLSKGVKFTITVSDTDKKNAQSYERELTIEQLKKANIASTYRNYYLAFSSANIVWNEGGKLLIDTEEQFVKYAYLATYGWDDESFNAAEGADEKVKAAIEAEKAEYFNGEALRSAIITKDLAFTGELWVERDLLESEQKDLSAFEMAIYNTYNVGGKNFALTPIGGNLVYDINGNGKTISGLTFNGSVFADTQIKTSSVSNLTLNATKVNADFFLAKSYPLSNLTLTNVKTGEGCELTPATEGQGAFFDSFNTSSGAPVETVLPKFAESENNIKYANTLIVTKPATATTPFFVALDDAVALKGEMNIKTADYNAIKTATAGTLYVIAATTDANGKAVSVANVAKALIENDVIGYNSTAAWHSVVTRDAKGDVTTSYWTGRAGNDNKDGIFTAEELAYVVSNRVTENKTLTCNLTLSNKPWVKTAVNATTEGVISINGNKKTISGAQIKATDIKAYNYTVFGYAANLESITVNSTTIDLGTFAVPSNANVAVLATIPGETVTSVTVGAPTIKMGNASKVETVGGLFAEADADQWGDINVEKTATKITTNSNATRYLANNAKFGSVVGKLYVTESGKFTKTVTTDAVNKIIGVVDFTGAEDTVDANFLNFGEGQYPGVATVLPKNGFEFDYQVFVYLGTEKTGADVANFFWYPDAKKWVVVAE